MLHLETIKLVEKSVEVSFTGALSLSEHNSLLKIRHLGTQLLPALCRFPLQDSLALSHQQPQRLFALPHLQPQRLFALSHLSAVPLGLFSRLHMSVVVRDSPRHLSRYPAT